jgi:hypothetical protein
MMPTPPPRHLITPLSLMLTLTQRPPVCVAFAHKLGAFDDNEHFFAFLVIPLCFNLLYHYVALIHCLLSAVSLPSSRLFAVYVMCIFDFCAY